MANIIHASYDSIEAFRKDAMDMSRAPRGNRDSAISYPIQSHRRDWFGPFGKDYQAAFDALQGWEGGRKHLQSLADKIEAAPPVSTVRRIRRADQGDDLDIQDVYAGRLDTAWRVAKRDHRATRSREIWLAHYMTINANTTGETIYWRGAAILALADLLTTAGYSVGIMTYSYARGSHEDNTDSQIEVIVKDPLAPLDIGALTGAIVNPGFFRILFFNWCWSRTKEAHGSLGFASTRTYPDMIQGTEKVSDQASAIAFVANVVKSLDNVEA